MQSLHLLLEAEKPVPRRAEPLTTASTLQDLGVAKERVARAEKLAAVDLDQG